MALPYHSHTFVLPTATKRDVEAATRGDLVVVPNSLGSMASKDESQYATAEQGRNADESKDWIDNTGRGFEVAIQQFIDNGFPNYISEKPYSVGSYVRYTSSVSGTGVYRSLRDNNTSAPNTNNWERIRALAFKDKVEISDIDAGGTPDNQSYLRGDGQWSSVAALVTGRDSFVTNPPQDFPESADNVVYAMNGVNAPSSPGAAHWFILGTLAGLNINNNVNQYLNGNGQWSTPPQPQPTGLWYDLTSTPYEDENILVSLYQGIDHYQFQFQQIKEDCVMTYNGIGQTIVTARFMKGSQATVFDLAYIHMDAVAGRNQHYICSGNRIFIDKR